MKNLSLRYFFLTLIGSLAVFHSHGQITFIKGYLINDKGDTLKGEVKFNPKKEQDCYNKVFFKDTNGVVKNYKPQKVKGYGFNGQNFVSMEFDNEMKYYRVLASGEINLYRMMYEMISMNQPVVGSEYYISRQAEPTKLTVVKEGKFKKQMTEWMKDNPEFITDFEDTKELNSENAAEAVRKYNAWKAGK